MDKCRRLCAYFCIKALTFSVLIQLTFIAGFIILVNFNIFHPFQWLIGLFGFHWLKHVFLIGLLLTNGLLLSKLLIAERKYYPCRFKWLLANGPRKLILMATQGLFGLLTSWSFVSYLPSPESSIFTERNGAKYLNSRCTFLLFFGIAGGLFHFLRNYASHDIELQFDYVPKPSSIRLRETLVTSAWQSVKNAFVPTLCFAGSYWICGGLLNRCLANFFGVNMDDELHNALKIFTNVKLLLLAWFLVAEIFAIMGFMVKAFSVFFTSYCMFPIGDPPAETAQVSLVTALSKNDMPILQKLAALDLYNLAKMKSTHRRSEIFKLSQLGGHPYNWNQLSAQCLGIINSYIDELSSTTKSLPPTAQMTTPRSIHSGIPASATELAQRVLIRQYNEMHNIRLLKSELHPIEPNNEQQTSTVARINANFEKNVEDIKHRVLRVFQTLPGLNFMFGEPEGLKTTYLLSKADLIIWIVQGLAYVCAASIVEDPFGIVQLTLPEIIKAFLRLRAELDKLPSVNLNGKKIDPNLLLLKNALKRSLHKICNSFADYLPEIVEDTKDLPFLRTFLYQNSSC